MFSLTISWSHLVSSWGLSNSIVLLDYYRQKLERTEKILEPVPIIGLLTGDINPFLLIVSFSCFGEALHSLADILFTIAEKVVELLVGAQTRYTYMSGS